jgi:hypothetical protein
MTYYSPVPGRDAFPAPDERHVPSERLSSAERQVVTLSRRDSLASVLSQRASGHVLRRLFGIAPSNPLADPRLEALRRYAVLLRHGGDLLASEARRMLRAHDMSEDRIRHARWLVTGQAGMSTVPET